MRFSTAYYFLLIYLTVVFQPLVPLLFDTVSHTFEDAIHLATVHAKYGDNHVEITIANAGGENHSNKDHNTVKTAEQVAVHFAENEYAVEDPLTNTHTKYPPNHLFNLSVAFIAKQSPPPKLS